MKKIFGALVLAFCFLFLGACASSNKKVYTVNKTPKILDAGFSFVFEKDKVAPVKQLKAGTSVYMYVAVKDSDYDVEKLVVSASRDGQEEDVQTVYLNIDSNEEFTYGVSVNFTEEGDWKFKFKVYDFDGRGSNEFITSLKVLPKVEQHW